MIIKLHRTCFVGKTKRKITWENNNMEKLTNPKTNKSRWTENTHNVNPVLSSLHKTIINICLFLCKK